MSKYGNNYMYETSPRKLKPEYTPSKEIKKKKSNTAKQANKSSEKNKSTAKKKKVKCVVWLMLAFAVLFAMSYQNSKINEEFSELKTSEKQLASIQKENEQLKAKIENSLNLSNVEQSAKEQLGMQKATTKQIRYVSLPKKDYVELASEQIIKNNEQNIFQRIINSVMNIVK